MKMIEKAKDLLEDIDPRRALAIGGVIIAASGGVLPSIAAAEGVTVINRGSCLSDVARGQHAPLALSPSDLRANNLGPFTLVNNYPEGNPPQPGLMGCNVEQG